MADFFNRVTGLYDGKIANDFYYKIKGGRKMYYSRLTGKRTSKDRIPKDVDLTKIEELHIFSDISNDSLQKIYNEKKLLIQQLQIELSDIDIEFSKRKVSSEYEEFQKKQKEANERYKEESDFFRTHNFENKSNDKPKEPVSKYKQLLEKHGIFNRDDWKKWVFKNHPDRGGTDLSLCQEIITAGNIVFDKK